MRGDVLAGAGQGSARGRAAVKAGAAREPGGLVAQAAQAGHNLMEGGPLQGVPIPALAAGQGREGRNQSGTCAAEARQHRGRRLRRATGITSHSLAGLRHACCGHAGACLQGKGSACP